MPNFFRHTNIRMSLGSGMIPKMEKESAYIGSKQSSLTSHVGARPDHLASGRNISKTFCGQQVARLVCFLHH